MESSQTRIPILIVGSTGHLGSLITRQCIMQPSLLVSIMDRDPRSDKELSMMVEKAGGKVFQCNICDSESLREPTKGMHTVISAIPLSDEKMAVEGQTSLLKMCKENGVQRFVPSDFSLNYPMLKREELEGSRILRCIMRVNDVMSTMSMPILRIQSGVTMETFCHIMQRQGCGYYGDSNLKHDMTAAEDVAKFVAMTITKKDQVGNLVCIGDSRTMSEICSIYSKVRGKKMEPKCLGSLDDLKKMCEKKRKDGDMEMADFCSMLTIMYDPRSKFEKNNNSMCPDMKMMDLEEFLRTHPKVMLE